MNHKEPVRRHPGSAVKAFSGSSRVADQIDADISGRKERTRIRASSPQLRSQLARAAFRGALGTAFVLGIAGGAAVMLRNAPSPEDFQQPQSESTVESHRPDNWEERPFVVIQKEGQNVWEIAQTLAGEEGDPRPIADEIMEDNNIEDPRTIQPGQELFLDPELSLTDLRVLADNGYVTGAPVNPDLIRSDRPIQAG